MLRINLLPAYIAQRRRVRNAIIGMIALFLLATGGSLFYQFGMLQPEVTRLEQEANDMQAQADQVTAYASQTAQIRQKVQPLKEKVQFVESIRYHNRIRQKIFRNVAKYTYNEVEYDSMSVNSNTLQVNGYVRQLADIGRFYITLFGNPDITAVSLTSPVPSYPLGGPTAQQAQGVNPNSPPRTPAYPVSATATLVRSVATPTLPASAQTPPTGATTGAAAGAPGAPPAAAAPPALPPDDAGAPPEE